MELTDVHLFKLCLFVRVQRVPYYCPCPAIQYVKDHFFLTHLTTQLHPLSCVILSPLIYVGSSYRHDFNLKMLASYLFL